MFPQNTSLFNGSLMDQPVGRLGLGYWILNQYIIILRVQINTPYIESSNIK